MLFKNAQKKTISPTKWPRVLFIGKNSTECVRTQDVRSNALRSIAQCTFDRGKKLRRSLEAMKPYRKLRDD
jgi:hypothetical protein